jgi:hypothetical protein
MNVISEWYYTSDQLIRILTLGSINTLRTIIKNWYLFPKQSITRKGKKFIFDWQQIRNYMNFLDYNKLNYGTKRINDLIS